MYKFDRELQKFILQKCIDIYPNYTFWKQFPPEIMNYGDDVLSANIMYLSEHGLIAIRNRTSDDPYSFLDNMRATQKGIDFILNDGGLSAILNVTTIKFHRDAVVVLEDLIAISNMSDKDKEEAKSTLSELSSEALKTVVQTAITAGLAILSSH
ncbi:TPA: hypothetical protein NDX14_004654 [Enterobacter hormaechei]|uniref:hypothetical protein n=1 Tax=Enterobacter cloacae complex TaxID=354276 RepID=UPI000791F9D0|nr:hypothetical protein [Enterobacter hormaechei]ELJ9632958.1 hypothetical protein [Enterobacter hormaechei]ELW9318921.1 hypothetical protein [Enterobacter hormaechei]EMC1611847.1 hypothetical protein [Enterobacter hormaechei]MBJ6509573.1 hypothetical protein [Enterobacter hormaechei]MBJ6606865.1 hypothetical protein [Enterobacter hormaechei]